MNNTFRETNVGLVMAGCIYLASKVEECPLHIKTVLNESRAVLVENGIRHFPFDASRLAEMEFYLVEELGFRLIVWHPYRSLSAICAADATCQAKREPHLGVDEKMVQMAW